MSMVGWLLMLIGMLEGKPSMLQGALSAVCRDWDEKGAGKNAWRALGSSEDSPHKCYWALMCPSLYWMILPTLFPCSSFTLCTWLDMFWRLRDSYSIFHVPPCWKMVFICYWTVVKNLSEKGDIVYFKLLISQRPSSWMLPLLGNCPLRKRNCM